ncbi:MAG TPA: hypothetical protein P5079_07545, partial [Elusimicrobiota bacterium]|nr:hypothetical protein [Elusimicrobiota bacterium]
GQIKVGVRNTTGAPLSSEVWVNEIHLSTARQKVGVAKRFSGDFTLPKWATFGGTYKKVDRNFQTLTSPVTNQDRTDDSAYLNFNRLSILPLTFSGSRSETITPAAVRTGDSALVSVLEEGRVTTRQGSGKGELILPYLPTLGFGYEKSITDSNLLKRIDDKDTYSGSLNYTLPFRLDLMPTRYATLRPLPDSVSLTYRRTNYFLSFYPEKKEEELSVSSGNVTTQKNAIFANVRTVEFSDDWSGRASFTPWAGLSINPNYAWKKVKEQRRFTEKDLNIAPDFRAAKDYDKSLSQTQGVSASWRLLRWLEPRFSYSVSGTETNVLPSVSSPTAYNLKSLDRTADGEASWTFSARELIPNFRPVQSLTINNSFRIQDGDTYENVGRTFTDWQKIQLVQLQRIPTVSTGAVASTGTVAGKSTKVKRQSGRPIFGLLRPLDIRNPEAFRKQVTIRNTYRSSGNWSPLDWLSVPRLLQPIKTFRLTATVTNTDEHSETTETIRDAVTIIWPDLIYSLRDTEKFFHLERWMTNSQANLRTNRKRTETFKVQFTQEDSLTTDYRFTLWRRYDLFSSYGRTDSFDRDLRTNVLNSVGRGHNYSTQVGMTFGSWRFTPSAAYSTSFSFDGAGKTLTDLTTRTYGLKSRFDKSYPDGFRMPFSRRVFGKVNRFTVDSNLTFERKQSSLNVERDNTDVYTASLSGEFEIAQNFRWSLGSAGSYNKNREKKDENIITYEINSTLVIQF